VNFTHNDVMHTYVHMLCSSHFSHSKDQTPSRQTATDSTTVLSNGATQPLPLRLAGCAAAGAVLLAYASKSAGVAMSWKQLKPLPPCITTKQRSSANDGPCCVTQH
jgi:hypothetical protein